ncbi:MAG TPA: phage tail protein [Candidatus Kapabacteria bacterium]|nr:phage tail protein [Candidatus Kapabacteria bacterium]
MGKGFTKDAKRIDPYKNFKFRVSWDGKTVLGVSKVGALKRTTEVVKHRDGGDNSHDSKSPGRTSYDAISMERGITHDAEFEAWANKIHSWAGDSAMDLANFKKELTLEIMNEKNQVAFRYFLHDCWVSEFTSVPELNANANAVAIESIKIEINGWERDTDTKEPDPNG